MSSSRNNPKPVALLNRRDFFRRAALAGAAMSTAGLTVSGCATPGAANDEKPVAEKEDTSAQAPDATPQPSPDDDVSDVEPNEVEASSEEDATAGSAADSEDELDCTGTEGLTSAEISVRQTHSYIDRSEKPGQSCTNCMLFKPPRTKDSSTCGSCKVMPGSIHPAGWCAVWVEKP